MDTMLLSLLTGYALLGAVVTAMWAPLLIDVLYRMNIVVRHVLTRNRVNEEFVKIHAHKSGTPTMGGLMISLTVLVLTILLVPAEGFRNVFIIGWSLFTLYGLVEGLMVFARKVDEKFKLLQESFGWRIGKLVILFLLVLFMIIVASQTLGVESITLWRGVELTLNWISIPLMAFFASLAMYGMEITDGLDGLVTGQFLIAITTYTVVVLLTGSVELLPYLALVGGSSLVYLYFNINPARVFMGGTGTLPIGFLLLLVALATDTISVFVIMGAMFWVELLSSGMQIIAIKFFKRKIFRIAPLHHHYEAIGWPETKVVQRFWLAAILFSILSLWLWSIAA